MDEGRFRKGYKNRKIRLLWREANAISAFTAPELSPIRSLTFVVLGNTSVTELATFLYFVFNDSIIHLPFFLNDPLAIGNQLPGEAKRSHNTAHGESRKAEDVLDVIRRRAGVSLCPAERRYPDAKIPHLSPQEINIRPSASFFSAVIKTPEVEQNSYGVKGYKRHSCCRSLGLIAVKVKDSHRPQ